MPRVDTTPMRRARRDAHQRPIVIGNPRIHRLHPVKTWDDLSIIRFLRAHVLSIPPRAISTMEPWVLVCCADGTEVALPRGYRIPLLWVLKFLWMSVALVLKPSEDEEVDRQQNGHPARRTAVCDSRFRRARCEGVREHG
ncbi:hypothetical protein B0H13DRAFT_2102729 [Mycena leptocephala]|nr:hypothetical protein B0H13DRAFT_2102729 [Mycena leptocephala]